MKAALEMIAEQKAQLDEATAVIDMQHAELDEKDEWILSLKGQLQNLTLDHTYLVG